MSSSSFRLRPIVSCDAIRFGLGTSERARTLGARRVPPSFGEISVLTNPGRTPKCTASPMCYTKVVGNLRIPAQDAMCASHPFFCPFGGVRQVPSQFGRGIEFMNKRPHIEGFRGISAIPGVDDEQLAVCSGSKVTPVSTWTRRVVQGWFR